MASAEFWIIPMALLGACIGSFLNVVVYRLPRGLSVTRPRWSFCPACEHEIRFRDNVPILSWLSLRGRCRDCGQPISSEYPVIEAACALIFVVVWDALFIARTVPGVVYPAGPLGAEMPAAFMWLMFFAGLLATAAMDVESYTVDIRICNLTVLAGVVGHAAWRALVPRTLPSSGEVPAGLLIAGIAAGLAWAISAGIGLLRQPGAANQPENETGVPEPEKAPAPAAAIPSTPQRWPVILLVLVVVAISVWILIAPGRPASFQLSPVAIRGIIVVCVLMTMLILASSVPRESDTQIMDEIEAERPAARRMALRELYALSPALLTGLAVLVSLRMAGLLDADWPAFLPASLSNWAGNGVSGAASALGSAVLAAGTGWMVRILGTLTFGKEAFGTGDIYIMAAIAAVGGLWLCLFAFFLAALLALVGALILMFRKRSTAIPFGPWLALGALVAVYAQGTLIDVFAPVGQIGWSLLTGRPIEL